MISNLQPALRLSSRRRFTCSRRLIDARLGVFLMAAALYEPAEATVAGDDDDATFVDDALARGMSRPPSDDDDSGEPRGCARASPRLTRACSTASCARRTLAAATGAHNLTRRIVLVFLTRRAGTRSRSSRMLARAHLPGLGGSRAGADGSALLHHGGGGVEGVRTAPAVKSNESILAATAAAAAARSH